MSEQSASIEVGLSLGANLGDRLANMVDAKRRLSELPGARLLAQSPVYETEPVDVSESYRADKFLNAVVVLSAPLDARQWLKAVGAIELAMGRVRGPDRNAPRPIDIDILYAGGECIDSGGLTVPHPRWTQRRFVVEPLTDVRPHLVLPGSGATVAEVLDQLADHNVVSRFTEVW